MAASIQPALETLTRLESTEPPLWLAPNAELSQVARTASRLLFSYLKPYSPKCPFDQLLVDGYDAEQIWQQNDLQSQPLLSRLRREVKHFEKNPGETSKGLGQSKKIVKRENEDDDLDMDMDEFDDEEDEDEDEDDAAEEKDDSEESTGGESETEEEDEEELGEGGVEDKFLKIKDLQKYLKEGEVEEFGLDNGKKKKDKNRKPKKLDEDEDEEDDEKEDEESEDDGIDALDLGADDDDEEDEESEDDGIDALGLGADDDAEKMETARYEDYFVKKKKVTKTKSKRSDSEAEEEDDEEQVKVQGNEGLSTHEKELQTVQSKIEQMEKANMDPKHWTMQGEVTAATRPKNSALEVDLDFDHNVRPAPVITEEVTASLEEIIKSRILEDRFDDVERGSRIVKAPRQVKELDDNKSKKGLAEVYEEEYVEKVTPAFAPTSFSDELKKEASMLFKRLCLKLDALSHFHFTPKPVIEDMSIQANVPALAMEEIAPLAVSDAAMLAPEEVFSGKGDIKEEAELTQAERKRRRANKKRKYKAETAKRATKKPREDKLTNEDGKEE